MTKSGHPHLSQTLLTGIIALILALLTHSAQAQTLFDMPAGDKTMIGKGVEYLEDTEGTLTLEDVRSGQQTWQTSNDEIFNQGYTGSTWWLRFDLQNNQPGNRWLLEIAYPLLDEIDLHLISSNGEMTTYALGDRFPFAQRPIQHRHFIVPVPLGFSQQASIYLRVHSNSSLQVPLLVWQPEMFQTEDIGRTAAHGIFFGGLLIIALYNLLVYLVLGERSYLYYVSYVFSMLLFMASLNGWSYQFLWPTAVHWNDRSILVFVSVLILSAWVFSARFLDVGLISRKLSLWHTANASLCGLFTLLALVAPYSTAIALIMPHAGMSAVWGMLIGLIAWRHGNPAARYFVLAWSILLIGAIMMAMSKTHLLPRNPVTDNMIQIGSLLEVLLLSFALAERINSERALRMQAQQEALKVQQQANEALEQRVAERTLALEDANRKLQELSDTDPLTALKNRRFLNGFLDKEFARACRYRHSVAVLMIDVDHFKSINDTHGHLTGDDCLKEVAARIRQQMRWPSDLAARYGGEEFCVVLPETSAEGAQTVAERIRASVENSPIATRSGALGLTVSIGLQVGAPASPTDAGPFVAQADGALYSAKQNGRNQVMRASAPDFTSEPQPGAA